MIPEQMFRFNHQAQTGRERFLPGGLGSILRFA
jgi:hypothetical protein